MRPSQTAKALRHIASKLDRSTNPDRRLVAKDLKRVLAAIGDGEELVGSVDEEKAIKYIDLIDPVSVQLGPMESLGRDEGAIQVSIPAYGIRPFWIEFDAGMTLSEFGDSITNAIPYVDDPTEAQQKYAEFDAQLDSMTGTGKAEGKTRFVSIENNGWLE